ncbi:MAG: CRISPR-associated endonuclease Cas2 [Planctomycetota bacterium]
MWYVVCYDVRNDKRRAKIARLLDDHGNRVQYSVFELPVKPADLDLLLSRLEGLIDPTTDSVYCYPLCDRCRQKTIVCGQGTAFDEEIVWIV